MWPCWSVWPQIMWHSPLSAVLRQQIQASECQLLMHLESFSVKENKKAFILTESGHRKAYASPHWRVFPWPQVARQRPDQSSAASCQPFATTPATSPAMGMRIPFPMAQAAGELPSACSTTPEQCELVGGKEMLSLSVGKQQGFLWSIGEGANELCWSVFVWLSPSLRQWCSHKKTPWLCVKKDISKSIN